MNIEREDFKKLSQLDRIEYRQRYSMISNIGSTSSTYFLFALLISQIIIGIGTANLLVSLGYHNFALYILLITKRIGFVYICLIFLCLFIDALDYIKKKKLIKQLEEEYFRLEGIRENFKKEIKKRILKNEKTKYTRK